MPKGLIRPSGGRPDKRTTCRVSISDIRRHAEMAPEVDINCGELLRMQLQLREAFSFYFAQQREVMKAPVMRRNLEQIATAARQFLAAPNKQKWRERLEDHLQTSRYDRPGLPVRTRLISTAGGPELSELESALDYGPLHENHLTTLKILAQMDCEPGPVTKSRDPSLQGMISVVVPLWEKITGRRAWAREENGDMVSPLHSWLKEIMGKEAPTNDQLIKVSLLLKRKK